MCMYVIVNVTCVFKKIEELIFLFKYIQIFLCLFTVYWEECFLLGHREGFGFSGYSARNFACAMLSSRYFLLPT